MDKLNIKPFNYEVEVMKVYDNGLLYDAHVLDVKPADIFAKLRQGANQLSAASLQIGYPTAISVKQSVLRGFRYLVASTLDSPYEFKEAKELKEYIKNPSAHAAAPVATEVKPEVKKTEVKKEEPEEALAGGLGDIFG